jgi:signal transduction histidine kinase
MPESATRGFREAASGSQESLFLMLSKRFLIQGHVMSIDDRKELEELALRAELARPLVHECNNLLNNLLLQLMVMDLTAEGTPSEWEPIRREGKKLAALLNQWQSYRRSTTAKHGKTDLNQLVRELVEDFAEESTAAKLTFQPAAGPLWWAGSAGDVKRLGWLLLQHAISISKAQGKLHIALEVRTAMTENSIGLQMVVTNPVDAALAWAALDETAQVPIEPSLMVLACKALAVRLQGFLRVENRATLLLELPGSQL